MKNVLIGVMLLLICLQTWKLNVSLDKYKNLRNNFASYRLYRDEIDSIFSDIVRTQFMRNEDCVVVDKSKEFSY